MIYTFQATSKQELEHIIATKNFPRPFQLASYIASYIPTYPATITILALANPYYLITINTNNQTIQIAYPREVIL